METIDDKLNLPEKFRDFARAVDKDIKELHVVEEGVIHIVKDVLEALSEARDMGDVFAKYFGSIMGMCLARTGEDFYENVRKATHDFYKTHVKDGMLELLEEEEKKRLIA